MIVSNFENILDEMQMTLALETLSECTGDVDKIRKNILPGQGTRKQRMQNFLRFILLYDHNVIVFEKMLERNRLYKILKMKEIVREEDITIQNIGIPFKGYQISKRMYRFFSHVLDTFLYKSPLVRGTTPPLPK